MCFAQGHNAVTLVRLEPATPRVKQSTTALPQKCRKGNLICFGNLTMGLIYLCTNHFIYDASPKFYLGYAVCIVIYEG